MNRALLFRIWRFSALRVGIVTVVTLLWGWLILLIYSQFSVVIRDMVTRNPLFQQMSTIGSGNLFTVPGAITLGTQHPLFIAFVGIFAVGAAATAIAGERQAGTLEIVLARPLLRRVHLLTHLVAILAIVALLVAALLTGMTVGAYTLGFAPQLNVRALPLVWLNGFLLWSAFTTFSLAASASCDRSAPAMGMSLAYLLTNYFLEVLGSIWNAAHWAQHYSLFHHFQAAEILNGHMRVLDLGLLAAASLVPLVYALWWYPRRDLAAPS